MGRSKKRWKSVELAIEKLYKMRRMNIIWKMVKDDIIVLEAKTHFIKKNGEETHRGFAAFLTFKNGKIIKDHTYMKDPEPVATTSES